MEVDGQYVSPSLAGIPVRLRVRNEDGRFDRRGVGRLRGTREVVESLKAAKDDEDGRWVTMNGRAVLIREGETPEEALQRQGQHSSDRGSMAAALSTTASGKLKVLQGKKAGLDAKMEIAQHRMAELQTRLDELKGKGRRKGVDESEQSIADSIAELKKTILEYKQEQDKLDAEIAKLKKS
jgi:chromosome segregation ATPase